MIMDMERIKDLLKKYYIVIRLDRIKKAVKTMLKTESCTLTTKATATIVTYYIKLVEEINWSLMN
jgi:hypothetical protein